MTNQKIHIVYFTGTGSTELVAKTLCANFQDKAHKVEVSRLFKGYKPKVEIDEVLVVLYPVYAGDAPKPIYEFISKLSSIKDQRAVVIPVSGGGDISPNTACRVGVNRQLRKKGYRISNEYMLVMPSNFIASAGDRVNSQLLKILPKKCEFIVDEVTNDYIRVKQPGLVDRAIRILCMPEKVGSKVFGRTLKVMDTCNGCGLCDKKCPVANINMTQKKPKFGWDCVLCMACVYGCPQAAIKPTILNFFVIKEGYNIKMMDKNTDDMGLDDKINNQLVWKGVVTYLHDGIEKIDS